MDANQPYQPTPGPFPRSGPVPGPGEFPGSGPAPGPGDFPGPGQFPGSGPVPGQFPGPVPRPGPVFGPGGRRRMPRGPRRRRRGGWFRLLLIVIFVLLVVNIVPTPWALHIGGRFTPLETWQGYGTVQASNGGHYVLYTHLRGGIMGNNDAYPSCSGHGCDTLFGSAKLCTESGKTYTFDLTGGVHSWLSTDGARTTMDLTGTSLPDGWVVAFHGAWHGPVLALSSPDNSFTEVFTARGAVRSVTSTAAAGTAHTTLRYGTTGGFTAACRALAAGAR